MSGNPVIFTGHTNIVYYTDTEGEEKKRLFSRVLGKFEGKVDGTALYTEEYTYPLGEDGNFQFDLSSALEECFRQLRTATINADGPQHTPKVVTYTLRLTEMWVDDGVTYEGDTVTIGKTPQPPIGGESEDQQPIYKAIAGALTDAERVRLANSDVAALLTVGKLLSRKPQTSEVVVKDSLFIAPYWNGTVPTYNRSKRSALGTFKVQGRDIYVTENDGQFFPMVFWNQFGMLESVVGHALPTYKHNLKSSQYEVDSQRTFHSIGEQHAQTSLQQQEITLSTGIVDRRWYEWWIAEVLTTPQVFVKLEGEWYSGTIVPESSITRKTDKGDALSIEFKVKLSVRGSIYNSWV